MTASIRYRMALVAAPAFAVLAVWSACGDPSSTSTGPSPYGPPALTCPANVALGDAPGIGEVVTYTTPVPSGGTPPVTTTCAPASGATFPIGATSVSCTAKDGISRSAVCSFSVTLTASHLGAMSFMAFGDSQTAGENGDDPNPNNYPTSYTPACYLQPEMTASQRRLQSSRRPAFIDSANAYPTQLLSLLQGKFVGESFTMDNEGFPGESAEVGTGRLVAGCPPSGTSVFARDHPDVFLLLEGVNDIGGTYGWQPTSEEEQLVVGYLQSDVAAATGASVPYTFVSTILPVRECSAVPNQSCRVGNVGDPTVPNEGNASIDAVNELIRAGIPGAIVVDGNSAFKAADPTLATLIGPDGLHPTPAGYAVLAQAYLTAITSHVSVTHLHRIHR